MLKLMKRLYYFTSGWSKTKFIINKVVSKLKLICVSRVFIDQYKLPVSFENRFLSAVLKEDIKDKNLSVRKFTYSQLGLYNPSKDENPNVKFQDKIIVPYSFYSAAIYEPHIFSPDDVLFGTLAFILGRENEIIGAETAPK